MSDSNDMYTITGGFNGLTDNDLTWTLDSKGLTATTISPTVTFTDYDIRTPTGSFNDMVERIEKIEQRLNILNPNQQLESEWDELKQLGEKYRELEQQLLEKQKVWQRLKSK